MAIAKTQAAMVLDCDEEDIEALADDLGIGDDDWEAEDLFAAAQLLADDD